MAQTTTAVNACNAVIQLDDSTGTLTDISGSTNNVTLEFTNTLGEFKTYGTRWMAREECGSDATFTIDIIYSTAADEGFDILKNWYFNGRGARTLQVDIPDSTAGSDRYSSEVLIESFPIPAPANEAAPVMVSLVLRPTGTVSHSEIAS